MSEPERAEQPARSPEPSARRRDSGTVPTGGAGDAVYGLGLIGALVYYWQHAHTAGDHVLAVLQALVWPALLVHSALEALQR